ncbi:MAG: hypothetical protein M3Z64_04605, partial [Verrucomicrobiota bacterium]|nr:hypothetical protein [Verrucomicrobiota bacterium]
NFTWRDRTADTIMLGASLFARQIQIEQIYVKQRANQFTLSGESAFPRKVAEWPEFRGDVSASIKDLSDFARLFGGKASDFGGELEINGSITEQEHKLGGELIASGKSLTLFGAPVDSLGGNFALTQSAVVIHQFDLRHGADSATASGTLDLSPGHRFTGRIAATILDLAPFRNFLAWTGDFLRPEGSIALEIQSDPRAPGGAGRFSVRGTALRVLEPASLLAFDAVFEGTYSAENIFFRRFDLRNEHAAFTTFLTVATDYVQFQNLRFEVNGKPAVEGEIFVPLTLDVPPENGRWISGIVPESAYSVDVRVPDLDLNEAARAISVRQDIGGKVGARIEVYGTTANPVGQVALHVRDFASASAARLSGDVEGSLIRDVLSGKASLAVAGTPPAQITCSLPVEFEPNSSSYRLRTDSQFDFSANLPAVALAKLPSFLKPRFAQDGMVRARVAAAGGWPHPQMQGMAEFADVAFSPGQKLSGRFLFRGNTASVDGGKFADRDLALSFAGVLDLSDFADLLINLRFAPIETITSHDARDERCINGLRLTSVDAPIDGPAAVDHASLRGALFRPGWSLTLDRSGEADAAVAPLIFCDKSENEGDPLALGVTR